MEFYICNTCGNLIEKIENGGTTPFCCGKPMQELKPGSTDGALEKHIPVLEISSLDQQCPEVKKVTVHIGAAPHPMLSYHHIMWILLETDKGVYRKNLSVEDQPEAIFYIKPDETILHTYAYCDLHGLWIK